MKPSDIVQYLDVALLRLDEAQIHVHKTDPAGEDPRLVDVYQKIADAIQAANDAADHYEHASEGEN